MKESDCQKNRLKKKNVQAEIVKLHKKNGNSFLKPSPSSCNGTILAIIKELALFVVLDNAKMLVVLKGSRKTFGKR